MPEYLFIIIYSAFCISIIFTAITAYNVGKGIGVKETEKKYSLTRKEKKHETNI